MVVASAAVSHQLIRASAGTGKTHALTSRFLQLLRQGARPDEILASTFTRKAAGEILSRIMSRLASAANDAAGLAELRQTLGDQQLNQDDCIDMLVSMARQLHRLQISTLDSFFVRLAGSFALEMGLPPGWGIAELHEDLALRQLALQAVIDSETPATLLTLVHALTKGETSRSLDWEVRGKIDDLYSVYCETLPEAWQRVPRLPLLDKQQWDRALQAMEDVLTPNQSWSDAHEKSKDDLTIGDWIGFVSRGLASKIVAGEDKYNRRSIANNVIAIYQPLIAHAQAMLLRDLANQTEATWQLLDKFDNHYRQLQSDERGFRFDQITLRLARFLTGYPQKLADTPLSPDSLAFRLDGTFRHLLLDEFQDTSLAQWEVIRPFVQRITDPQAGGSLFCVGDTKQAIYGWRGGVAEIFDNVAEEVASIEQSSLDMSWRSSPVLMGVVNRVFTNLHQHPNLDGLLPIITRWQSQFQSHRSAPPKENLSGYVCLQAGPAAEPESGESVSDALLQFAARQVAK